MTEQEFAPLETRRVQRTGGSSLSVTLPKFWTEAMNIRNGDTLSFHDMEDGALVLRVSSRNTPEGTPSPLVIDASEASPNLVCRLLVGAYITGHDRIQIRHISEECRRRMKMINQTASHMVGMSLVVEKDDLVEFQVFVDPSKHKLSVLLERVAQMLHMLLKISQETLEKGVPQPLDRVDSIEDEIDRFYFLIARQILLASNNFQFARSIGVPSHHFQLGYRMVAKVLEVVGDLIHGMDKEIDALLRMKEPPSQEIREVIARQVEAFDSHLRLTMRALYGAEQQEASRTLDGIETAGRTVSVEGHKAVMRARSKEMALHLHDIIFRIVTGLEMLKIVNEIAINRAVDPEVINMSGHPSVPAGDSTPPE